MIELSKLATHLFEVLIIGLVGAIWSYAKQIALAVADIKTQNAVMLERLDHVADTVDDHESRLRRVEYPQPN